MNRLISALFAFFAANLLASPARVTIDLPDGALPVPPGPYEPTWDSLEKNWQTPAWFLDGKFGIFIHWGVYSVAARQSEWYPRHIYLTPGIAA